MAKVFIQEETLTSVGDAIKSKNGTTELLSPTNMANAIAELQAGSGSISIEVVGTKLVFGD